MCVFPTFGKRCSQRCECEKQLCNFELGCPKGKYCLIYVRSMHLNLLNDCLEKHDCSNVVTEL